MNKFWPTTLPHPRALTDRWRTSLAVPGRSSDARRCTRRVLRRPAPLDCEPDAHPQRSTCPGRRHAPRGPADGRSTRSSTDGVRISVTCLIVRSRALDRGPRRDTVAGVAGGTTTCAARAPADSSKATVAYAASAVTRAMSATTASIRSVPVVASSTFASGKAWAMITPDPSTPSCRVFQPRLPRPPCFTAAHSPSPTTERPGRSTMRGVPAPAGARRTVGSRC